MEITALGSVCPFDTDLEFHVVQDFDKPVMPHLVGCCLAALYVEVHD